MRSVNDEGVTVLGTVGDVNPVEYGGGVIVDDDGEIRVEYFYGLDTDEPDADGEFQVYYATVEPDVFGYHNWLSESDLEHLAEDAGCEVDELREQGRSENPVERVLALELIAGLWGWGSLDHYPAHFTESELRERWDCED